MIPPERSIPIFLQARTGSSRLARKVLADIEGKPLLAWELERVSSTRLCSEVVVLTTSNREDDPVVDLSRQHKAGVYRGHPTDVLGRYAAATRARDVGALVRISGDSPLLDGHVVDAVVQDFLRGGADIVANHRDCGWPEGTAVEVLSAEALRTIDEQAVEAIHREHVTLYAYDREGRFKIRHLPAPPDLKAPELRLCVDTAEDLRRVREICAMFAPRQDFGVDEVVAALAGALPQ
jgi:spore coat polysaccharide biosynthesis protein SpsF